MNRRQKIIVSITGIFLVLLILVGLTYAYFLTRIQGNTNEKSISVTTANLLLVYGDGTPTVIDKQNIKPNDLVGEKTFTVTNNGDAETDYVVVLDNVKITTKDGTEAEFESNDFVYTLTCGGDKSTTCEGVGSEKTLPLVENGILVMNTIGVGVTQTYKITITYKDTGIDQSSDMGKKVEARINIKDPRSVNPYKNNIKLLSYKIIDNAMTVTKEQENANYAVFKTIPLTKPGVESSISGENTLSITNDDYGISYYYRGGVKNNYLNFAGKCWRIVRIQGDGSIKITLADRDHECNNTGYSLNNTDSAFINSGKYAYDATFPSSQSNTTFENSNINILLSSWLNGSEYDIWEEDMNYTGTYDSSNIDVNKLANTEWCNDFSISKQESSSGYDWEYYDYYGAVDRLSNSPSLQCDFQGAIRYNGNIGLLTADEVAFAGGSSTMNNTYYLYENASSGNYWTMSPYRYGSNYGEYGYSMFIASNTLSWGEHSSAYIRPVVTLLAKTEVSEGVGTKSNPYVIN